ncbi:MAG TPA: hypothetical protein VIK99_03535 [Thermaerobacter sp.]
MSCLVLDARGIPLPRPMSPSQARREVRNGAARWVHAEGIEPNPRFGTVQYNRSVAQAQEQGNVVVLHADGVPLGWIQPAFARRYMRDGRWMAVGELRADGTPRAVILPALLSPFQLAELVRLEGWLALKQATMVAIVRHGLEVAASALGASSNDAQSEALGLLQWMQRCYDGPNASFPAERVGSMVERAVADLMRLRDGRLRTTRRIRADRDADFAAVRQKFLKRARQKALEANRD